MSSSMTTIHAIAGPVRSTPTVVKIRSRYRQGRSFYRISWSAPIVIVTRTLLLMAVTLIVPTQTRFGVGVVVDALQLRTTTTTTMATSMRRHSTYLHATTGNNNGNSRTKKELFKAGLFANLDEEAAQLASQRIKSLRDLGWDDKKVGKSGKSGGSVTSRRVSSIRPKFWAWGGADEVPLQDKPNYDPSNIYTPDPWLSLDDLYERVGDDTAVADTIFVALAGGRAFCEKETATSVLNQWWDDGSAGGNGKSSDTSTKFQLGRKNKSISTFNEAAFYRTVQRGRQEFVAQLVAFLAVTGFAVIGIVFPTNPVQLALVDTLEGALQQIK